MMAGPQEEVRRIIKLLYTNADMLPNKMTELIEVTNIHWPDIIGVNEVKYKNMNGKKLKTAEFIINKKKYDIFGNNVEKLKGRGQILHIEKRLRAEEIELTTCVEEVLAVRFKLNNNENMIVALVYRSPSSTELNNERICHAINEICKEQDKK